MKGIKYTSVSLAHTYMAHICVYKYKRSQNLIFPTTEAVSILMTTYSYILLCMHLLKLDTVNFASLV